jgi:peptidyl-tRNA hydrolase
MQPANHNDPIVVYVIVREELNMSVGKIAAQCCHGIQKLLLHYFKAQVLKTKAHDDGILPKVEIDHIAITTEWLGQASRKVVLAANEKEWAAVKAEFGHESFVVTDAGYTELQPGTETTITLYPMRKSQASRTIQKLQTLK